jgi:hypothetical protein
MHAGNQWPESRFHNLAIGRNFVCQALTHCRTDFNFRVSNQALDCATRVLFDRHLRRQLRECLHQSPHPRMAYRLSTKNTSAGSLIKPGSPGFTRCGAAPTIGRTRARSHLAKRRAQLSTACHRCDRSHFAPAGHTTAAEGGNSTNFRRCFTSPRSHYNHR